MAPFKGLLATAARFAVLLVLLALCVSSGMAQATVNTPPQDGPTAPTEEGAHLSEQSVMLYPPVPGGPNYFTVNAMAFRPWNSGVTPFYSGIYLSNRDPNINVFTTPVYLPNGVTIKRFVIYYKDNDPSRDLTAILARHNFNDTLGSPIASITSSGASSALLYAVTTSLSNPVVDLQAYNYYIDLRLPVPSNLNTTELYFGGVRVDYGYPNTMALPAVIEKP